MIRCPGANIAIDCAGPVWGTHAADPPAVQQSETKFSEPRLVEGPELCKQVGRRCSFKGVDGLHSALQCRRALAPRGKSVGRRSPRCGAGLIVHVLHTLLQPSERALDHPNSRFQTRVPPSTQGKGPRTAAKSGTRSAAGYELDEDATGTAFSRRRNARDCRISAPPRPCRRRPVSRALGSARGSPGSR